MISTENSKQTKDLDIYEYILIIYNIKNYIFFFIFISIMISLFISKLIIEDNYKTDLKVFYNNTLKLNTSSEVMKFIDVEFNKKILIEQLIFNLSSEDTFSKIMSNFDNFDNDKIVDILNTIEIERIFLNQGFDGAEEAFVISVNSNSIDLNNMIIKNLITIAEKTVTEDIIDYLDREISYKKRIQELNKEQISFEEENEKIQIELEKKIINQRIYNENEIEKKRIKYEKKLITQQFIGTHYYSKRKLENNFKIAKKQGYENPQFNFEFNNQISDNLSTIPLYFYGYEILGQELDILNDEIRKEQDLEHSILELKIQADNLDEKNQLRIKRDNLELKIQADNLSEKKKLKVKIDFFNTQQEIKSLYYTIKKFTQLAPTLNDNSKSSSKSFYTYNFENTSSKNIAQLPFILVISIGIGSILGLVIGLFIREQKKRIIVK